MTATRIGIQEKTRMTMSLFKSQDVVLKMRSKATPQRRVFHAMAARPLIIYPVEKGHPTLPNIVPYLQTMMMTLMISIHVELPAISHPQALPTKWTFLEQI